MNTQFLDSQSARTLLPSVLCTALTIVIFAGFFIYQSILERNALLITIGSQEQSLQQTQQVKAQLQALATGTAKLAEQGDAGAKEIIAALKAQGVNIRP